MKKYTQKEFDEMEVIDDIKQCPSGDYSDIKNFGEWCRFGEWCSFGKRCSFGECCSFGKRCRFGEWCSFGECCKVENKIELTDYLKFEGFGSEKRCTYFFKHPKGIFVRCGCFAGDIEEFREKVKCTHGGSKDAEGYLKIADLAEWQFH